MNVFQQFINYLRSSKIELEKVAWPTKESVLRYSALVVGVSLVAALFFAVLDTALHSAITAVIARRNSARTVQTQTTPDGAGIIDVTTDPSNSVQAVPTENVITGGGAQPVAPTQP